MQKRKLRLVQSVCAATLAACAGQAFAQVNVDPTKANGDFISGSGIPGNNFQSHQEDVSVFMKARARVGGDPLALNGNTAIVLTGLAPGHPTASWWSFDFQFTPRLTDVVNGQNYLLTLFVDVNPTAGTNFKVVSNPFFDADVDPSNSWDENDGYFVNPGGGAWSTNDIDYVFSQSWRADFGFLNGSILPAGDYELKFTAMPMGGPKDGSTVAVSQHVRVLDASVASLTLDAQDACLDDSETQVIVEINLANAQDVIVGGQYFLSYDKTKLDFVSADAGDAPFTTEIFELVNEGTGEITYSTGDLSGTGTSAATTMARLTFEVLGDFCAQDDLVTFRTGVLPTRLTDDSGADIQPNLVNLHIVTHDSVAPVVTPPPDLSLYADAGTCSAVIDGVENFEAPIATGPTQAPGVWYTDRYPPAAFESSGGLLRIGIDDSDSQANRPGAYSSAFYNTQGRKYDVNLPVGTKWSGKLYIPSDWGTDARRSDIWATTFGSQNAISGYPILGFVCNDPSDPINPDPVSPSPRFRWYTQDTDQNPSNGYTADWVDLGLPSGFSYNRWWTLEIEMTSGAFIARVIDDTNAVVLTYTDILTFGSVRAGNIIMQAYNFGEDYDALWDDITIGPEGAIATDNCSDVLVTYSRPDGLSMTDPFPVGTTPVTWSAADACGNTTTATQYVTVDGNSLLDVAVELQGVVNAGPFDRCITFELTPVSGPVVTVSETMTFNGGIAVGLIEVPCGTYTCITARDGLHTLRSTDSDDFLVSGTYFVSDFRGGDELIGGNLNADTYIDILDFGILVGQFGQTVGAGAPCGTVGPHADITGDGSVTTGDFTFVQINFLKFNEALCTAPMPWAGAARSTDVGEPVARPVTSISVEELRRLGLEDLVAADLNEDGMLDTADLAEFMMGARPNHLADVDGSGRVDFFDAQQVIAHMNERIGLPYDMNGDGWVTIEDLQFVINRLGMTFGH
ncbi:MAG: hypothetical protein KJZ65_13485 [Phycisphaerales bacterium]|nr:hypothetical protein [Phycisphaerales bacterium]